MAVKLARIDDRLIHGQVILGWVPSVKPDRIVVANDRVAGSDWERKFYSSCVPPEVNVSFATVAEAARQISADLYQTEQLIVLLESAQDTLALIGGGVELKEVNVGGLHYREGSVELLPFVFLVHEERNALRELVKRGVTLSAQDVPSNPAKIINSLVV
ncbi:MAG TPA: PTS sugar transporter subunit IIB [Candidatus Krumholzibacteria bacterium]|jgi:mannose/fructose/N-acetylgalactosamine-specific phosphotransferase system component IIB|nr:PTS sugar transporter subunit IIB [Candidatus Krumholzibacteria bacterium]